MKKILFITQSYPSVRSANVICDSMIIRQLVSTRDVEVHCLCMRYHGQLDEELVEGVHVHRFRLGGYFELKDAVLKDPCFAGNKYIRMLDKVLLRMNEALTIPMYPCYYPFRTLKYINRAEALYRKYGFDIVACEHFGYETMVAGYALKKKHQNIRYIQFFWDALSGGTPPKYLPAFFIDKRRKRLESKVLNMADDSVAMLSHKESLSKNNYAKSAEAAGRLHYMGIPYFQNVFKKADPKRCSLVFDENRINIVFAGNLWGRNLSFAASVVSAVKELDIVLWIVTSSDLASVEKVIGQYSDHVKLVPYLNHDELLNVLLNADALLNMGVKNPNAISGKIFEYMGCCKPIISTYSIDNEACLEPLRRYPLSFLMDERRTDIAKLATELASFLSRSKGAPLEYDEIEELFYDCTPEAYCKLFDFSLGKTKLVSEG